MGSDFYAEQNLRLANQMLEQQGEIIDLKAKLAAVRQLCDSARGISALGSLAVLVSDLRRILDDTGDTTSNLPPKGTG